MPLIRQGFKWYREWPQLGNDHGLIDYVQASGWTVASARVSCRNADLTSGSAVGDGNSMPSRGRQGYIVARSVYQGSRRSRPVIISCIGNGCRDIGFGSKGTNLGIPLDLSRPGSLRFRAAFGHGQGKITDITGIAVDD